MQGDSSMLKRNSSTLQTLIVGLSFSGKLCLHIEIFIWLRDKEFRIKTTFPPETNRKTEMKEIGEEIKDLNEFEFCVSFLRF